jgi:hypothetical protein
MILTLATWNETWKAKEEMAAEPGAGSEDHAGQKMVGEGGV